MKLRHIAVGYDGSAASEEAVRWAVREAARRDVMVLLITACPPASASAVTCDERLTTMVRAFSAQQADLLVLGSDRGAGLDAESIPGRVAARLSVDRRRGHVPLVVIATPHAGTPAGQASLRVRIGPVPGSNVPAHR